MKKGCLIVLGVVGALAVIALVVLMMEDAKYEFLWASPAVSHETLVTPETCVQLVIRPDAALSQLPKLVPNSKIPPSFLGMVLPYEIALLCSADPSSEHSGVTVFVNDRRLGPMIQRSASTSDLTTALPAVTWSAKDMKREARGKLTMTGTARLKRSALDIVSEHWSALGSFSPLKVEGKHLLSAVFDNRWGGVFALAASLPQDQSPEATFFQDPNTIKMLAGVSVMRVTADLAEGNTANVDVDILTNPQANMIFGIKLLLDGSVTPLSDSLKKSYGVTISGSSTSEGDTIKGHYVVSNVDRLISGAGGAK